MNIDFSNLQKIENILQIVTNLQDKETVEKRWLSVKELAEYIDYSTDRIHKLKGEEFIEGIHYYKRSGKLLFDKSKIDNWVMGIGTKPVNNVNVESTVNNILSDLIS